MTDKFSISNFIKSDTTEETISEGGNRPDWLSNSSSLVNQIYDEVNIEITSISNRISNGDKLSIKERRIVKSKIAERCCVDRSYITKRRMPEIVSFIDEKEKWLDILWKSKNTKKGARDLSKKQLEKEVVRLKVLLNEEKDKNYSELMTKLLVTEGSRDHSRLIKQVAELKVQNSEHLEAISRLRSLLRKQTIKVVSDEGEIV